MKLMENAITGAKLRVVEKDGEHWFVAKDICDALGIKQTTKGIEKLDDDEVHQMHLIDGLGRQQLTYVVSESGLYGLILRSDKPGAKVFRKWVTSEVLPEIRKTGSYGVGGWEARLLELEDEVSTAMRKLQDYRAGVAGRLGIITNKRIPSLVPRLTSGRLDYAYDDWGFGKKLPPDPDEEATMSKARVNYAKLAQEMPLPQPLIELVRWMMVTEGVRQKCARRRIERMIEADFLNRNDEGIYFLGSKRESI